MSAAGTRFLGSLFSDVMKPKVAAPVAAGGLMLPSDDAEAKIGGVIKNIDDLVIELNTMVKNGVGARHKSRAAEAVMHNDDFTNYNEMNTFALDYDGTDAGPYWMEQVAAMADEVAQHPQISDGSLDVLNAWRHEHLNRKPGDIAKKKEAAKNKVHKKQKPADPNLAFGDLKTMMAAAAAAGGAGTAKGEESVPTMGWGEWPAPQDPPVPTSPAERGFQPWSDYEPQPTYLDRVTSLDTYRDALLPYFQAGSWLANTPVGKYVGGQLGEAMDAAQVPGQIVHGATRGAYGLATGESPRQAFDAALEVGQNDLAENGRLVTDWANQRGWHPTDAKAAGLATEFLADPLTYAGMGRLGKIGKAF